MSDPPTQHQWRPAAEQALAKVGGGTIRSYSTYDFGRARDEQCMSVVLPKGEAASRLPALRQSLPPGAVAFIGTSNWLGDERHDGVELVVGPGASQFDILPLARTDAVNYDMDTEDIIRKLQEYDRAYGITLMHAETDTVEFNLHRDPQDLAAFAAGLYEFCPDIVDQGVGSVEALAESIEITGAVYLWWD